jgi:hypothetical protein
MPAMDIHEAARRVGALAWTEQRLFEIVGGWVASTPELDAKLLFARLSRHHGDHVVALTEVLPDTRDHDPSRLVAAGDDDPTGPLTGTASTPARLATLVEAVSQQLTALDLLLADGSPVRDAPVLRVARVVRDDDAAQVEAAAALAEGNR